MARFAGGFISCVRPLRDAGEFCRGNCGFPGRGQGTAPGTWAPPRRPGRSPPGRFHDFVHPGRVRTGGMSGSKPDRYRGRVEPPFLPGGPSVPMTALPGFRASRKFLPSGRRPAGQVTTCEQVTTCRAGYAGGSSRGGPPHCCFQLFDAWLIAHQESAGRRLAGRGGNWRPGSPGPGGQRGTDFKPSVKAADSR